MTTPLIDFQAFTMEECFLPISVASVVSLPSWRRARPNAPFGDCSMCTFRNWLDGMLNEEAVRTTWSNTVALVAPESLLGIRVSYMVCTEWKPRCCFQSRCRLQ